MFWSGVSTGGEVAVLLPEPLRSEVRDIRERDGEVAAVRLARQRTGLNLMAAVRAVRALDQAEQS